MDLDDDLFIIVPKWEQFQHYKGRDPVWIKVYTKLLHDSSYMQLSLASRGLLQMIWLHYAASSLVLRVRDVRALVGPHRGIGLQLKSLRDAGFIDLSASRLLAAKKEKEEEKEEDSPLPPTGGNEKATPRARKENPRAVAKRSKVELHENLLTLARSAASSWPAESTPSLHERLDELEREHGGIFTDQERQTLIDGVLERNEIPF